MEKLLTDQDRLVAARVVTSSAETVYDCRYLRATARAAFFAAGEGEEPEILVGLALAARDAGDHRFLRAVNQALTALDMPRVFVGDGEEPREPENAARPKQSSGEHVSTKDTVWRSESKDSFGGRPMRLGDRALAWLPVTFNYLPPRRPILAVCAEIDDEGRPVLREISTEATCDGIHVVGDENASLAYVESVHDLGPGRWTRLPW